MKISGMLICEDSLGLFDPENEGTTIIRNVDNYLPVYIAYHPCAAVKISNFAEFEVLKERERETDRERNCNENIEQVSSFT